MDNSNLDDAKNCCGSAVTGHYTQVTTVWTFYEPRKPEEVGSVT